MKKNKLLILTLAFLSLFAGTAKAASTFIVQQGGTGISSAGAYQILTGGTTSTGPFQTVSSVGTSGQVLTSNGPASLPSWQPASGGGAQTLADVSTYSTNTAKSLYTMTTSTPIEFRSSASEPIYANSRLFMIDPANDQVLVNYSDNPSASGLTKFEVFHDMDVTEPVSSGDTAQYSISTYRGTYLSPTQVVTGDTIGGFTAYADTASGFQKFSELRTSVSGTATGNEGGVFAVYTKADGGSLLPAIYVTPKQYVGINNSSPSAQLDVYRNVNNSTIVPYASGASGGTNNLFRVTGAITVPNYNYASQNTMQYYGFGGVVDEYGTAAVNNAMELNAASLTHGTIYGEDTQVNIHNFSTAGFVVGSRSQLFNDSSSTISLYIGNYLPSAVGTGTISSYYAYYNEDPLARNYFAGRIGIGADNTSTSRQVLIKGKGASVSTTSLSITDSSNLEYAYFRDNGAISLGNFGAITGLGAIGLGYGNSAGGQGTVVFGTNNVTTGQSSIIGGYLNTVSAAQGVVLGSNNTASNTFSAILGNNSELINAFGGVALGGYMSNGSHSSNGLIGDGQTTLTSATADNQFISRFSGGHYFLATGTTVASANFTLNSSGNLLASSLKTGSTAPSTSGTLGNVVSDSAGLLSFQPLGTLPYVAKTGTYTATTADYEIDCTSGTFTVTLPNASAGNTGKLYVVTNSGAGVITVTTAGGTQVIGNGALTSATLAAGASTTFHSTGAAYRIN